MPRNESLATVDAVSLQLVVGHELQISSILHVRGMVFDLNID